MQRETTTMHDQYRPPGFRPPDPAVAVNRLRRTSERLRSRLLTLVLAAVGIPLLLAQTLGDGLAASVFGPFTFGMLTLCVGSLAMVAASLWYDRSCRTLCDPRADELQRAAPKSGPAVWRRP